MEVALYRSVLILSFVKCLQYFQVVLFKSNTAFTVFLAGCMMYHILSTCIHNCRQYMVQKVLFFFKKRIPFYYGSLSIVMETSSFFQNTQWLSRYMLSLKAYPYSTNITGQRSHQTILDVDIPEVAS